MNTTWRKELAVMMESNMDLCDYVCTLSEEEMDIVFDDGFGIEEGLAFTAWTDDYVYFPLCYDGSEWVGSVPRNPNGVSTMHLGGG